MVDPSLLSRRLGPLASRHEKQPMARSQALYVIDALQHERKCVTAQVEQFGTGFGMHPNRILSSKPGAAGDARGVSWTLRARVAALAGLMAATLGTTGKGGAQQPRPPAGNLQQCEGMSDQSLRLRCLQNLAARPDAAAR